MIDLQTGLENEKIKPSQWLIKYIIYIYIYNFLFLKDNITIFIFVDSKMVF